MPKFPVEFSEIAIAGLCHAMPDENRRKSIEFSIRFFLKSPREAIFRSRRCPAFEDKDLYLWPIEQLRVLFEVLDQRIIIWHIRTAINES
jgi:hypothetical protein